MKLTKELEKEILDIYNAYWDAYLKGDMQHFANMLDENLSVFGTAISEVFNNKQEAVTFYNATAQQMVGKADFRNRQYTLQLVGDAIFIREQNDLFVLLENEWSFYDHARITAIFRQRKGEWKLVHQHASFPDNKAGEGEQIAAEKIKQENLELREAVKRRTVELEYKNRELEIEASLERVRSSSMAMHSSEELGMVVTVLLKNLLDLGFIAENGAAVHLIIFSSGTKDFVQWSADPYLDAPVRSHIPFTETPLLSDFFDAKANGLNFFTKVYSHQKKNEFFKYAFEHSDLKHIPAELKELILRSETYTHWMAIEENSAISVNSNTGTLLSENQMDILKRFARVFEQAYIRFLDLQKAEAQAREAQIEAALERVRSASMAMHSSDELQNVIRILTDQLTVLGFEFHTANFITNASMPDWEIWISSPGSNIPPKLFVPYFNHRLFNERNDAVTSGKEILSVVLNPDEKSSFLNYFFEHSLAKNTEEDRIKWVLGQPGMALTTVVTKSFSLSVINYYGTLYSESENEVIKRLAHVFEQSYTRFLDLQKAEAQAREAQIEAALERVRSRSMAMHKTDELLDAAELVYRELSALGINSMNVSYAFVDESEKYTRYYSLNPVDNKIPPFPFVFPNTETDVMRSIMASWQKQEPFHVIELDEEETLIHQTYIGNIILEEFVKNEINIPFSVEAFLEISPKKAVIYTFNFKNGYLFNIGGERLTAEQEKLLLRFTKVFEQTYTRFLDLQKAETQAREAQIELSLERIRAKVTAMRESPELLDIVVAMRNEFIALGHEAHYFWYMRWLPDKYEKAMTSGDGTRIGMVMDLPRHIHGDIKLLADWEKSKEPAVVYPMDVERAVDYVEKMISLGDFKQVDPNAPTLDDIRHIGGLTFIMARTTHGEIGYSLPGVVPEPPAEGLNTLVRFAGVFDLAYRRFEDLKEAERQNRETQIELALERVRSRTMGMQKSDELKDVIQVVYEQFAQLNILVEHAGFIIDYKERDDMHIWLADKHEVPFQVAIPYFDCAHWNSFKEAKETGSDFFANQLSFEEKNRFYHDLFKLFPVPDKAKEYYMNCPGLAISTVLLDNIGLYIENFAGTPYSDEENATLMRFGKVFQQTYTRFLDLQKAESQAREAQIEVAVERVRAKALAMHKSAEIITVVLTMRKELESLNIPGVLSTTITLRQEDGSIRLWDNTSTKQLDDGLWESSDFVFRLEENHPDFYLNKVWNTNEKYFVVEQYENDLPITVDWVRSFDSGMADTIEHYFKENDIKHCWHPGVQLTHGKLNLDSLIAPEPEMETILSKMGAAFDLAYKRFLDLQKAEYQTQQAKIETALEKVRARALAMHQPEELIEVAEVLRHEMGLLGVEELETCSIYINDEAIQRTECWYALKENSSAEKKLVSDHFPLNLQETWVGREMGKFYQSDAKQVSIVMQGANRKEWINYCEEKSNPFRGYYGELIPDRTYHLYKFSHGAIGAASAGDISAESWDLLHRASSVFSLAYSRFKDLTQARIDLQRLKEEKQRAESALEDLQNTQKQLVQSEKMASLGELTAGIAHEIQNPLNFVNNFSEVSKELLDEMKEQLAMGNAQEANEIMQDVIQNLEKINYHGKRADGIVKGMLQHSRSSNSNKEPTDINALCDEYLRLAYHGLRAKENSFNATMKTEYDETIGNISIIPQDIGRVILNLIMNAFYAVDEKRKEKLSDSGQSFEPTVAVSTRKAGNKVELTVHDNGNGIPQKALDKIFQPFFTTKPTGQGTGLGLSLSYDIVKTHGGELRVETKEGEGSEFIMELPIN